MGHGRIQQSANAHCYKCEQKDSCDAVVSSPLEVIAKAHGRARIWRCPGGAEACPSKTSSTACAVGYEGVGCAICSTGFAWAQGHECVECPESTGQYKTAWAVPLAVVGLGAYYRLIARPLFAGTEQQLSRHFSRMWSTRSAACSLYYFSIISRLFQRVQGWYDKVAEEVGHYSNMMKITVGFLQVITSLLRVDIDWPIDFDKVIEVPTTLDSTNRMCAHMGP